MTNWDLIAKYIRREKVTPEEQEIVEKWLAANKHFHQDMLQAMGPINKSLPNFSDTLEEDWKKIIEDASSKKIRKIYGGFSILKIAAGLLLFCLAGFALWNNNLFSSSPTRYAALDSIKQIQLVDGSVIWLNKNSSLTLDGDFSESNRNVSLEGEAYFEVAKDSAHRFTIQINQVQVQVLGTTFNVNSSTNGDVKVTVNEGKVSVAGGNSKIFLTQNEQGTFEAGMQNLQKNQKTDLNYLFWKTGIIRFQSTSLVEACALLSQYYGVHISIEESIKDANITCVLDNLTFDQAIEIVALTLELGIEKNGASIKLSK